MEVNPLWVCLSLGNTCRVVEKRGVSTGKLRHLTSLFIGAPKPEACWGIRRADKCGADTHDGDPQ